MPKNVAVIEEEEEVFDDLLIEIRCRSCGLFLGYRKSISRFAFWCSEPCFYTPMSKSPETQVRDEVMVELWLTGVGIMDIARILDVMYQQVQQTVRRRIDG